MASNRKGNNAVHMRGPHKARREAEKRNWHLTGKETMQYIQEVHTRQEEKQKKNEKYEKIKTEAVKNAKKNERNE